MRIAVLMASAGSRLGGLETAAREFAGGLANRGHMVTLVTGAGPAARLLPGLRGGRSPFRVVAMPMLGQNSLPARLAARLRGTHPAVIEARIFWEAVRRSSSAMRAFNSSHVVSAHFEIEAVAASNLLGIPVVYYYPGPLDPIRLSQARFSRMVAMSETVARYHASLPPLPGLPTVSGVVTPGIRPDQIASAPPPGVSSAWPESIFTGRLDNAEEKGVDMLLDVWPAVLRERPEARLCVLGAGRELGRLRQRIASMGLAGRVSLPGGIPHEQMGKRLGRAGLYLFPSRTETFGIAPLEAMGAGLPVIASDIPALRESLGDAALFLPPQATERWAEAIVEMLARPDLRAEWAQKGLWRAQGLTWGRQAALYEAYLAEAASGAPASE